MPSLWAATHVDHWTVRTCLGRPITDLREVCCNANDSKWNPSSQLSVHTTNATIATGTCPKQSDDTFRVCASNFIKPIYESITLIISCISRKCTCAHQKLECVHVEAFAHVILTTNVESKRWYSPTEFLLIPSFRARKSPSACVECLRLNALLVIFGAFSVHDFLRSTSFRDDILWWSLYVHCYEKSIWSVSVCYRVRAASVCRPLEELTQFVSVNNLTEWRTYFSVQWRAVWKHVRWRGVRHVY